MSLRKCKVFRLSNLVVAVSGSVVAPWRDAYNTVFDMVEFGGYYSISRFIHIHWC